VAVTDNPGPLKDEILELLHQKGSRVLSVRDVADHLLKRSGKTWSREQVERTMEELERQGKIVAIRGKRYSVLEFTPFLSGRLRTHTDGHGVLYGDGEAPDVYIDRRHLKGAMNGDLVLVRADRKEKRWKTVRGRKFLEGEVSRVLQREHLTVVGRFHAGDSPYVVPFDVRIDTEISIDPKGRMNARDGEMVNVEIERYPDQANRAYGRVVEVLGFIGEPGVDIEVVIRKYHIPHRFPDEVLASAESIPQEIDPKDLQDRVDLRDHNIVTIDGETAKDFDDAVEVQKLANGNYLLGVHIADVAHYVTENSALDREAFERGTSVYFPGRAVPMLPERLSNGICSLNPRVDRLTFSVDIEIDRRGRFVKRKTYKSVIRTRERMTYTDVAAILTDPTPELRQKYGYLWDEFQRMHQLFEVLRARRDARGSIDFDMPEAEVLLTETGDIRTIGATQRNVAHRLIEEFMLSANEAIAEELFFAQQPALYRVHQPPDIQKIEDLKGILKEFKYTWRVDPEQIRPGDLQKVLKDIEGRPEQRFLTEFILRSMKRAIYSEECLGHFALALQYYCHFTSPIRRYPDLIVHRRLAELLSKGPAHGTRRETLERQHPIYAQQSSEREKRSEDAEREVLEWKKVIFMRDKIGQRFQGFIVGVVPFGLFVELKDFFVQGLVPVSTVAGDYWVYREREHRLRGEESGREFRLGDPVSVEVEKIDEDKRQIEFRLVEAAGEEVKQREQPQRPYRPSQRPPREPQRPPRETRRPKRPAQRTQRRRGR
jgi:ribonuclease R